MKYKDITFCDFIYAIKNHYKSMMLVALIVALLGSGVSSFYVYVKEDNYQNTNIEIGILEIISDSKSTEEMEKIILTTEKTEQINSYITAIVPYADEEEKIMLSNLMEDINEEMLLLTYIFKIEAEEQLTKIVSLKRFPETIHNAVKRFIPENLTYINKVINDINAVIEEVELISDNIIEEKKIKIHDESKVLDRDTYVYSYFSEKLDVSNTIIAYIIFFTLMGIATGYLYGFIKFINLKGKGEHILKR